MALRDDLREAADELRRLADALADAASAAETAADLQDGIDDGTTASDLRTEAREERNHEIGAATAAVEDVDGAAIDAALATLHRAARRVGL